ncbi:hypothetical protein [Nostoc flagelliforme]|uniref:hypothetical protein n=1 Tax=Nostoc flagelliforme TaxID=1306274 RepID=UPI000C2CE7F6|nr:hypothetical protein [Nostoc flagelliforme]
MSDLAGVEIKHEIIKNRNSYYFIYMKAIVSPYFEAQGPSLIPSIVVLKTNMAQAMAKDIT